MKKVYNFSAGPAVIPEHVLKETQEALVNWRGLGISVMSVYHRSDRFLELIEESKHDLKTLLNVPESHEIIFLSQSASAHFSMVPLNLLPTDKKALYLVEGLWSAKAFEAGEQYGSVEKITYETLQEQNWQVDARAVAYVHICPNETVDGVALFQETIQRANVPIVADMSSCILSEAIDFSKFDLIYAGAQKNIGPAGFSIAIFRKDLNWQINPAAPVLYQYLAYLEHHCLINTPATLSWYITSRVFKWLLSQGGVNEMARQHHQKSNYFYDFIDSSSLFHNAVERARRSRITIPVKFVPCDKQLAPLFIDAAEKEGLFGLAGHPSRGGLRACFYNAMPLEGVETLVSFMKSFERQNG